MNGSRRHYISPRPATSFLFQVLRAGISAFPAGFALAACAAALIASSACAAGRPDLAQDRIPAATRIGKPAGVDIGKNILQEPAFAATNESVNMPNAEHAAGNGLELKSGPPATGPSSKTICDTACGVDRVRLRRSIAAGFDALTAGPYKGRAPFLAVIDLATGAPVFLSDADFYENARVSPGSIVKLVSAGLLFDAPAAAAEAKPFFCTDRAVIGGIRFTCSYKGGHGKITPDEALSRSCNLYFQNAMRGIPRKKFAGALRAFGLAGMAEAQKLVSSPDHIYYQAVIGDAAIEASPKKILEMITAIAAGTVPRDDDGMPVISREACARLNACMRAVVTAGTASKKLSAFDCAGKTGSPAVSVNISKGRRSVVTDAIFAGYSPFVAPRFAVLAYSRNGMGGEDAAAIAAAAFEAIEAAGGKGE